MIYYNFRALFLGLIPCISLYTNSLRAMESISNPLNSIHQLSNDIYIGESFSDANEKIYFGMEKINSANHQKWVDYHRRSKTVISIISTILYDRENYLSDLKDYKDGNYLDSDLTPEILEDDKKKLLNLVYNETGYSAPKIQDLFRFIDSNLKALRRIFSSSNGLSNAIAGFSQILGSQNERSEHVNEENTYVAYASKTPIIGEFTSKPITTEFNLTTYQEAYGDLIMCIGVKDVINTAFSIHRGIFRNPIDFLTPERTYKGVAMELHRLAGRSARQFLGEKKYIAVYPMKSMRDILHKSVNPGDMFLEWGDSSPQTQFTFCPIIRFADTKNYLYQETDICFQLSSDLKLGEKAHGEDLHILKI